VLVFGKRRVELFFNLLLCFLAAIFDIALHRLYKMKAARQLPVRFTVQLRFEMTPLSNVVNITNFSGRVFAFHGEVSIKFIGLILLLDFTVADPAMGGPGGRPPPH